MVKNNTIIIIDGDIISTSLISSANPWGLGKEKMAALHSIDED